MLGMEDSEPDPMPAATCSSGGVTFRPMLSVVGIWMERSLSDGFSGGRLSERPPSSSRLEILRVFSYRLSRSELERCVGGDRLSGGGAGRARQETRGGSDRQDRVQGALDRCRIQRLWAAAGLQT